MNKEERIIEERIIELDLVQLAKALWGKAVYIVIIALIFGMAGFAGSKFLKTPIYQASAKLIVNTQSSDLSDVSNDRVNSAKALVDTYAIIIRDRDVINQVIDELELTENYGQLVGCISVKAVNNTQVMQIVVQHSNQATAFAVANKIQSIAPDVIKEIVGIGFVKPAGQTYSSPNPVSPNNVKDAILMALLGFALACGLFVALFLLDDTYKSDADIQDDLNVLVLGVIPKVECCGKYKKYGYGYKYAYGRTNSKEVTAKEGK